MKIPAKTRNLLSKVNFELNRKPAIEKNPDYKKFIPDGYESVCLLSTDFEMAWAWKFSKNYGNPLQNAINKAKMERQNIPHILSVCNQFSIPLTWATVGHLFLNSCNPVNQIKHPEIKRLSNFENTFWKFNSTDWFESDPCTNYQLSPEWYAPDLIDSIIASKTKQEIACHTFSHIDCSDNICPSEVLKSELDQCKILAQEKNIELKSFVHPGHFIGNLNLLAKEGFTSFRTDNGDVLAYPVKHKEGIWEIKNTAELYWRDGWNKNYHQYRFKKIIDRSIANHSVCVFWFHPSFSPLFLQDVFPYILEHLHNLKNTVLTCTTSAYINFLNKSF